MGFDEHPLRIGAEKSDTDPIIGAQVQSAWLQKYEKSVA
jgi:hypothetical protein